MKKTLFLAFLFAALTPAALVTSCTTEDESTTAALAEGKKIDCNGDSKRPWRSQCGNGGVVDCCWKEPVCDALCDAWQPRKDGTFWCP